MSLLTNRANHVLEVVKREGVVSLFSKTWRKICRRNDFYGAANEQWRNQKFAIDKAFDSKHGVQTGGIQNLFDLNIKGNNRLLGIPHIACNPEEFERGLAAVNIDYSQFTFIDLGSGKGRALMLAAQHPFRHIIGVEFAEELHRAAEENFRKLAAAWGAPNDRIKLVHEDAGEYPLPDDPLLIFLYQPFGEELMRKVAKKVLKSYCLSPRKISIYYLYPVHECAWTEAGYQVTVKGPGFTILIPPTKN